MRKKVLIFFPLKHIAFSPTTLGIYDALQPRFDVTIYSPDPGEYKTKDPGGRNILYFAFDTRWKKKLLALPAFILKKLRRAFFLKEPVADLTIFEFVRYHQYSKAFKKIDFTKYDDVIAVDVLLLYLCNRHLKQASFLSLELNEKELPMLRTVKNEFIKAVIVQTPQRFHFLFGDEQLRTFYVQNAPSYKPLPRAEKIENGLAFNGTATPWFGMYHCLDFLKAYPQFSLTFKGIVFEPDREIIKSTYSSLWQANKIIINDEYLTSDEMLGFLSKFQIGFCFYDMAFPKMNTFNYHTAPSGKMFAYLASGVPVIANRLDGLLIIEEFEAGILIDDFSPATMYAAVQKIMANYSFYAENCIKAAKHYSFEKTVAPFVSFLLEEAG